MSKLESIITLLGIITMTESVIVILAISMSGISNFKPLRPVFIYLLPIFSVSTLTGMVLCIRDSFLRFKPQQSIGLILLFLFTGGFSYPYYYSECAKKPRVCDDEKNKSFKVSGLCNSFSPGEILNQT